MDRNLYRAVTSGNMKALESLVDGGVNVLKSVTPTGNTALHLAAYHGHVKAVEKLLQIMNRDIEAGNQGSHEFVTAKNEEGNTALHEAAIGRRFKVVEFLVEHHRNLVDNTNHAGETALFKATEEGDKKIVEKLLPLTSSLYDRRTSDGQSLLQCAIYNTHKGVLKKLIAAKPELLQEVDNLGQTPLHKAAYLRGISNIARILLEKDMSLCYKVDINQQTALHIAVQEGNVDLVIKIINCAEDCIEMVDNDGRTALHMAVENAMQIFDRISRQIKTLVLLVTSKRLINKPDNLGKTALDIAIENMGNDERLFYGIKRFLERNGARRTAKKMEETNELPLTTWKVQIVSVNAVLIATVAFAAAFTLPKDDPKYSVNFQIMVICDALAFCSSISSAVLLMYALYGKQEDPLLLKTSIIGLWVALVSLLLTFGTSIHEAVAPKHGYVAGIVLAMVSFVPILIRIMIFRSKKHIFSVNEHRLWTFFIFICIEGIIVHFTSLEVGIVGIVALLVYWIGEYVSRRFLFHSNPHLSLPMVF